MCAFSFQPQVQRGEEVTAGEETGKVGKMTTATQHQEKFLMNYYKYCLKGALCVILHEIPYLQ